MSLQNAFFVCHVTVEFDAGKLQIKSPQSHQALNMFFQRLKRYFVARKARDRRVGKVSQIIQTAHQSHANKDVPRKNRSTDGLVVIVWQVSATS